MFKTKTRYTKWTSLRNVVP